MSKRKTSEDPLLDLPKKAKMDNGSADGGNVEIDENLHSRQLAVYGREVMRRMAGASVLVSGANGVGVEIGMSYRQRYRTIVLLRCKPGKHAAAQHQVDFSTEVHAEKAVPALAVAACATCDIDAKTHSICSQERDTRRCTGSYNP